MRKLASIQRIKSIEPIEGADAIMMATVLGWELVVKKDEFKAGDLVVYCEVDSMLPDKPEFEFLKPRGMRIKTIRLRGQVSQGICFPLGILPPDFEIIEDADCTEALKITKYEPSMPASLAGIAKGNFPGFIPKTDETRVQVLQEIIDKYAGTICYVSEKIDGSSVTYYYNNGQFGVCSRNLDLEETEENTLWQKARELHIEEKLKNMGGNFALQGEMAGEGIQGNKLKMKGQTPFFFNLFDIDKYQYANYQTLKNALDAMELTMVPVIDENYVLENDIRKLIEKATTKSTVNNKVWAEGIIIRPLHETIEPGVAGNKLHGNRLSFKVINPEFLIKYGE
ncbi:RNA ligase (ATP) [bacterium]|nr:RNA ligase (ATP) [bacterium]